MTKHKLSKWVPTTNLLHLRRFGKLGEELSELGAVTNRCIIQGIDEIDPSTQKTNRLRLQEEIADVLAQSCCTIDDLELDKKFINSRVRDKIEQMAEWEDMFKE